MRALAFPFNISGGAVAYTTDYHEIVRNQLIDSVMTNYQERIMRPEYGADMQSLLFDPSDTLRNSDVSTILTERLTYMVPRATIENVNIVPEPTRKNVVNVNIRYRVNSYDEPEQLSIPVPTQPSDS